MELYSSDFQRNYRRRLYEEYQFVSIAIRLVDLPLLKILSESAEEI